MLAHDPDAIARPAMKPERAGRAQVGSASLLALTAFLVVAVAAVWKPPLWVAGLYLVLSVATFIAYAADKSAAASGSRRTPERALHLLALAGGWPGALLAQQFLRHKTIKPAFRHVFWTTVVLNVAALVLLVSPLRHWMLQAL